MIRFFRWLDDVLFSPPHRFEDVLRQILPLLEADCSETDAAPDRAAAPTPAEAPPAPPPTA